MTEEVKDVKDEEGVGFMAKDGVMKEEGGTWLFDSGCSNHMSRDRSMFQFLESTSKQIISLRDGKALQVERLGSVSLGSRSGKTTILTNVQFDVEFSGGYCISKESI